MLCAQAPEPEPLRTGAGLWGHQGICKEEGEQTPRPGHELPHAQQVRAGGLALPGGDLLPRGRDAAVMRCPCHAEVTTRQRCVETAHGCQPGSVSNLDSCQPQGEWGGRGRASRERGRERAGGPMPHPGTCNPATAGLPRQGEWVLQARGPGIITHWRQQLIINQRAAVELTPQHSRQKGHSGVSAAPTRPGRLQAPHGKTDRQSQAQAGHSPTQCAPRGGETAAWSPFFTKAAAPRRVPKETFHPAALGTSATAMTAAPGCHLPVDALCAPQWHM